MKIMRKSALLLLIIIQMLGLSVFSAHAAVEGDGTEANPYKLTTAEDLFWFAGYVNGTLTDGDNANPSASAILMNDIVINEGTLSSSTTPSTATVWTPIGTEAVPYSGSFDGNGKTITGIYVTAENHRGMFGYVTGEIKNLNLDNTYIDTVSGKYSGGIAGYLNGGKITGCTATGKVMAKKSATYNGGIVGYSANKSVISGCINKMYMDSDGSMSGLYVGGIAGGNNNSTITACENRARNHTLINNSHTGGIAGINEAGGYITDCHNYELVSAYQDSYAGGIVSVNDASTVSGCTNNGDINSGSFRYAHLGGIVAESSNGGVIRDCINTRSFDSSYANIGGIAIYVKDTIIENCCNTGNLTVQYSGSIGGITASARGNSIIRNCYNTGDMIELYLTYTNTSCGGIVGSVDAGEGSIIENCFSTGAGEISKSTTAVTRNCYYIGTEETDALSGTTYKTADQFASGEVCYLLNGDQSEINFYQTLPTDLHPSFDGKQVYYTDENGYYNVGE